jgi:preprotein translocase subunit SecD
VSSKGTYDVQLTLSANGSKKFSAATGRLVGKPIAIFMDNKMISAPVVESQINTTTAVIEMNNTTKSAAKEASKLADQIRGGALPIKLKAIQVNQISPILGMNALQKSIWAGIIAISLVFVFMLVYYRLPGLVADMGLFSFAVLNLLALAWIPFTNLTLPGIAGVILSIGMAVDANVIIFERVKEELKSEKTLKTSIDLGFKRAMTAIIDANLTTVIAAVVLWIFGEGPIKGFAYTLGLGVMISFLTAITICRILITTFSNLNIAKNKWLYGA